MDVFPNRLRVLGGDLWGQTTLTALDFEAETLDSPKCIHETKNHFSSTSQKVAFDWEMTVRRGSRIPLPWTHYLRLPSHGEGEHFLKITIRSRRRRALPFFWFPMGSSSVLYKYNIICIYIYNKYIHSGRNGWFT